MASLQKLDRTWLRIVLQSIGILVLAAIAGAAVNSVRSEGLSWQANWSAANRLLPNSAGSLFISLDEAKIRYFTQSAIFIDARSSALFRAGHIDGALNLSFQELDQRFSAVMHNISFETPIITYCDGKNCDLSEELAFSLLQRGYEKVQVLKDGWTLWKQAGLPLAMGNADVVQP